MEPPSLTLCTMTDKIMFLHIPPKRPGTRPKQNVYLTGLYTITLLQVVLGPPIIISSIEIIRVSPWLSCITWLLLLLRWGMIWLICGAGRWSRTKDRIG